MYTLQQIAEITNSRYVGIKNHNINCFLNDSRIIHSSDETLFVALKSTRDNGHNYILKLIGLGIKSFLIQDHEFDYEPFTNSEISFVISKNPLQSLQVLATHHRKKFTIPVIGITGSNGKTMLKEWLYQLLKSKYTICRSPKSFNSQIGVPLSVLNLNNSHTLAIFEAGISLPNEMDKLYSIIQPTIGILSSFGSAHDQGFINKNQKLNEKLKLFKNCNTIIINGLKKSDLPTSISNSGIFISEFNDADYKIICHKNLLQLITKKNTYAFTIPFTDLASFNTIASCVSVLLQLGFNENEIKNKLKELQPIALRLEIKNGINNSIIINDYYNSDLDSIKIALNQLHFQNHFSKKIVIISDIEQSGIMSADLYKLLADLFNQNKIDFIVGIGKEITHHASFFKENSLFFNDTESFINQFKLISNLFKDASILLKGSRNYGFESIGRLMQLKSHDTVFEINLNKLIDNVNYYRSLLSPNVKIMCMVKAMAYGSGSSEISKILQHVGVNYLAVAYADEGVELRQSKINLPIMVMNPEIDSFEDIINYQLEPEIYSFKSLHSFTKIIDTVGITDSYPIHLKIDTGMHRLGFEEHELIELIKELKNLPQLKIKSVFSHLVASNNNQHDAFTNQQILVFEKAVVMLEKELGYEVIKHICNSGGISRFNKAHFNMVRLGIGMYGLSFNADEQANLNNVGTLKTTISQIKHVLKGETIGYNRSGIIEKETKIATIPIGYADGFNRLLGNGNHGVYINKLFCKTIGNICMDMTMIDVTDVNCMEGDEVIIFENTMQINAMAKALNSIAYEVLTNVSARVKRVYLYE